MPRHTRKTALKRAQRTIPSVAGVGYQHQAQALKDRAHAVALLAAQLYLNDPSFAPSVHTRGPARERLNQLLRSIK